MAILVSKATPVTEDLPELLGRVGRQRRSRSVKVSIAALGRTSVAVKALTNSISRLIAVLNRRASRSSVTAATVRAMSLACSGVGATS